MEREREEREGGESTRKKKERGKRARSGADFSARSASLAPGIQVRLLGVQQRHRGEGSLWRLRAWLFSCGMLKDRTQTE